VLSKRREPAHSAFKKTTTPDGSAAPAVPGCKPTGCSSYRPRSWLARAVPRPAAEQPCCA